MRQHNNLHREYRRNISLIEGSEATLDDLSDDPQYAKFRAKIGKRDAESLRGLTFRLSFKSSTYRLREGRFFKNG